MSDTPRTDAMIQPVDGRDVATGAPISVVHADDCRALERELAAAYECLETARKTAEALPALRKDAEHYRWLRSRFSDSDWLVLIDKAMHNKG